ncbi:hypothetical protein [Flavobacterium sp. 3HN19-14]|uniref:hypothetical protein n=1 Tax=Flavobacterium sp. 3HN19-14 TaxID=3448133 RepID=UPI003EDF31B2
MKYFYSIPSQPELNRLFGYNVGIAGHYKKNTVVDPNGQVSNTYLDPQGRTIATALSSGSPINTPLLDETTNSLHTFIDEDLLNKLTPNAHDTPLDNNVRFSTGSYGNIQDGLRLDLQKTLIGTSSQPFTFDYYMEKVTDFDYECSGTSDFHYPFIYNLKRTLTDDCGTEYSGTSGKTYR